MRSAFIVVWLALQIGLPLRYYMGDDVFDERFAWRMFSPVRLVPCQVRFIDTTGGGQELVRPETELHEVWTALLTRARRSVIEGYAERWCDVREARGGPPPSLRVDITCSNPHEANLPICRGSTSDRNGNGLPDAYDTATTSCRELEARACYERDCGDRRPENCRTERCQVRPVPADLDLCD